MAGIKKHTLYNGKVHVLFSQNARNRYVIEETGKSPLGVTTTLGKVLAKPALMLWPMYENNKWLKENFKLIQGCDFEVFEALLEKSSKAHVTKSDKGKDTGHMIHAAIEAELREEAPELSDPTTRIAFNAWKAWMQETEAKAKAIERVVYSQEFDYAGTADAILEIDGKILMVDWKSTNASRDAPLGVYSEHFVQLGAYSLAFHEEKGKRMLQDLAVVNVSKTGSVNVVRASELGLSVQQCEETFKQVLALYRFLTPLALQLKEKG